MSLNDEQKNRLSSYASDTTSVVSKIGERTLLRGSYGRGYTRYRYLNNSDTVRDRIIDAQGDPRTLREISIEQHKVNSGYIEVIEYFKNMFYFRYTVTPSFYGEEKERANHKDLKELAKKMTFLVDELSLETALPKILEKGLVEGVVYLYMYKKRGRANVMILPYNYCQRYRETNYDTETVLFDFSFFTELLLDFQSNGSSLTEEEILSMYPTQMVRQYKKYREEANKGLDIYRFQELNISHASAVTFHPEGIPPKILVSAAKEDYDDTVSVERRKGQAQIDSILTVELPMDQDGVPLFTATEAGAIQQMLASQVSGVDGLKVLTSFGKTNLLKPQQNESVKNEATSKAYNQIFEEAMLNPELFRADTDYALQVSLNRDAGFIWTVLERIMNFYNMAINKIFPFPQEKYEIKIRLLEITKYNFEQQQNAYRRAAEYGIGKLESVISTGIKQSEIYDKSELEEALELDDILKPLQSSHTRSAQELKNIKDDTKDEKEVEETKDENNKEEENKKEKNGEKPLKEEVEDEEN